MVNKRILLVSYYCPSSAHAGGLRILDIYRLIKEYCPTVTLDLYTCRHPEIDGSYTCLDEIFDNVYFSPTNDMSPKEFLEQNQAHQFYNVIDLQFHQTARHIDAYRSLGAKILFTPMESLVGFFFTDFKEVLYLKQWHSFKVLLAELKHAYEEFKYCKKADEVVCVSSSDAAILKVATGSKNISSIETGLSTSEFKDVLSNTAIKPNSGYKENQIIYVAYFGSPTNISALKWYLEKVHPIIKNKVTDYMLLVVGRGDLSDFKSPDETIKLVGEVPLLGPYISKAKLGIAPALGGSGFRGKVNQYSIYAVPSVVSPIAAKGLAYINGNDILIAESPNDFADCCISLLNNNEMNTEIGNKARLTALSNYTWESKLDSIKKTYSLEDLNVTENPKVTVLVPSYNHARYLKKRIESIFLQTYKNFELIVIDDCSSDDSDMVIKSLQSQYNFKYIRNERNSGTPFAAWEKIISLADGEYIWICESDDYAEYKFLETAINAFKANSAAVLFYCDSFIVDENGHQIDHTDTFFHETWRQSRWDRGFIKSGLSELFDFQLRGQTVPNMSSALILSSAFRNAYHPIIKNFKLTGDWLFVGWVMKQGAVVYCKETLNNFRQHEVTSRVRVKSARSQAEYILTKYLLSRVSHLPWRNFASLMKADGVRFLSDSAGLFDVLRALFNISPLITLRFSLLLFVSLLFSTVRKIKVFVVKRVLKRLTPFNLMTYVAVDTTNEDWQNGVGRKGGATFFIDTSPEAERDFRPGNNIIFADNNVRMVISNQKSGKHLIVHLEGKPLEGKIVGYPKPIKPFLIGHVAQNLTNGEWVNGIAKEWAAAFLVNNTPDASKDLAAGKIIIFDDKSVRVVMKNEEHGKHLIVFVDGNPLDGKSVGYPKPIKPYLPTKYFARDITNNEWFKGVASGWATAFHIYNTPEAAEDFSEGNKVIFSDSTVRTILRSEINDAYLIAYLDGSPLDGRIVGYPMELIPQLKSKEF